MACSLTLHHAWRSSASRRVRLCLAEKGLDYESRIVDLVRGEQHSSEYLRLNPNGVVPALVHDGRVVHESAVIAEYLEETWPEPSIRPADPYARAVMRNFVRWIDEHCLPKLIVFNWSVSMQPTAAGWSDAEKAEAMRGLVALLDRTESMLGEDGVGGWLVGGGLSIADLAAAPFVMRISELNPAAIDPATRPLTVDWWQRVRSRPSFARARIDPYDAPAGAGRTTG